MTPENEDPLAFLADPLPEPEEDTPEVDESEENEYNIDDSEDSDDTEEADDSYEDDEDEEDEESDPLADKISSLESQLNEQMSQNQQLLDHILKQQQSQLAPEDKKTARDILEGLNLDFDVSDEQYEQALDSKEGLATLLQQTAQKATRVALEASEKNTAEAVKAAIEQRVSLAERVKLWQKDNYSDLEEASAKAVFEEYLRAAHNAGQITPENVEEALEQIKDYSIGFARKVTQSRNPKSKRRGTRKAPNLSPNSGGRNVKAKKAKTNPKKGDFNLDDFINPDWRPPIV